MKLNNNWSRGIYSGNYWLSEKSFDEIDYDDEFTKKLWLKELQNDPDYIEDMEDMVKNRISRLSKYFDINNIKIHMAGESHLDMAYKWRFEQTEKKAVKTLKKAVEHCEIFPESENFKFIVSSPQIFDWIDKHDPILLRKISKWVSKGNIELVGGSWVETDCMMPSGESFARSRLWGMKKCKDLFGEELLPKYEWFPDSFGYNAGLPQILAKSGALGIKTQKMTWCKQNIFPFIHFNWESPSGDKILAVCNKGGWSLIDEYEQFKDFRFFLKQNGQKEWDYSHSIEETLDENLDKSNPLPTLGLYVGKGNGGHGPTHQEVTEINGMIIGAKKLGYNGVFKWSGLNNFFEDVEKYRDQLATWKDELYLEDHRGTFTTHPEIKRHNRRLENLILTSERFVTYHSLINPNYQYPYKILERLWKTLNLLQFHDVLPGSCIPEAFDDLPRIWAEIDLIIKGLFDESFYLRGKTEENRISIINPLDWERRDRLFIPYNVFEPLLPLDSEGKPPYITLEIEDEKLVCQPVAAEQQDILKNNPAGWWTIVNIPANGVLVGSLKIQSEDDIPQKESFLIHNSEKKYSNGLCSIELNSSNGAIKEIIVEGINKNKSLVKGEDNFLVKAYEEPGHDERYPAWNLKEEYWKYPIKYNYAENLSIRILDDGPIFFTIEIKRTLEEGMNKIIQEIRLFKKDPVIYCSWIADWKQADVMLKIGIDTTTNAKECISEQMFCDLKRSTEPHTLRDKARYEKIMHSYVDLSTPDNSWGIALLNEGKYAFDCRKSTNIDLTLHKTAIYPQPNAESWANIEREFRKKMDGEQVPKNVGLRLLSCRFAYYPHSNGMYIKNESGYKSLVRQKAKEFNNPLFVWKNTQSPKAIKKDSLLLEISSSVFWRLPSNIEVVSIKRSEWDPKNSIIIRLYENCGQSLLKENGEVHLPDIFKGKIKNLIAVDLLEREIKHEFEWLKNSNIIKVSFRPFETCSFELMFS